MAYDNKNKKGEHKKGDTKKDNEVVSDLKDLKSKVKQIEKQAAKVKAKCNHRGKNGKLKIEKIGGSMVECERCGERFNIATVDQKEIEKAIEIVHNVLQQARCLGDSDKESDRELVRVYGEMDYNLKGLPTVYAKMNNKYGNKKNKKRQPEQSYYGPTSFLGK